MALIDVEGVESTNDFLPDDSCKVVYIGPNLPFGAKFQASAPENIALHFEHSVAIKNSSAEQLGQFACSSSDFVLSTGI